MYTVKIILSVSHFLYDLNHKLKQVSRKFQRSPPHIFIVFAKGIIVTAVKVCSCAEPAGITLWFPEQKFNKYIDQI